MKWKRRFHVHGNVADPRVRVYTIDILRSAEICLHRPRAASFVGKTLALAHGGAQGLDPPPDPFREWWAVTPPRTLPRTVRSGGGLSPQLETAQ